MGFQFIHIESYARKADKKGRSTGFIFDEVTRRPGASEHVQNPGVPTVVYGMNVEDLRVLHDDRAEEATTQTKAGKSRKIRNDQHTLLTVITSHPETEMSEDVERWQAKTIEWLEVLISAEI